MIRASIFLIMVVLYGCSFQEPKTIEEHIEDAFQHNANKEYDKALESVNLAYNTPFSTFCGNHAAEVYDGIHIAEAVAYLGLKEYQKALSTLQSKGSFSPLPMCFVSDSLKIEALIGIYGKDKVKKAFKNGILKFKNHYLQSVPQYIELSSLDYDFYPTGYRKNGEDSITSMMIYRYYTLDE